MNIKGATTIQRVFHILVVSRGTFLPFLATTYCRNFAIPSFSMSGKGNPFFGAKFLKTNSPDCLCLNLHVGKQIMAKWYKRNFETSLQIK